MAAPFWHILNIKHLQWPETEIKMICWNLNWKIRKNALALAGFSQLEPLCVISMYVHRVLLGVHGNQKINLDREILKFSPFILLYDSHCG